MSRSKKLITLWSDRRRRALATIWADNDDDPDFDRESAEAALASLTTEHGDEHAAIMHVLSTAPAPLS